MGYMITTSNCVACNSLITFNPDHVPSLVVNGQREPLCRSCHGRWNEIHRTSKGLEPIPIHAEAYGAKEVS